MRLKHVGILETKDGIKHGFLYEKSYPVRKDLRFKCGLTSMFYGGVCWKYFFMPNNKQKVTMLEDTDHRLKKLLGGDNYKLEANLISKVSYEKEQTSFFTTDPNLHVDLRGLESEKIKMSKLQEKGKEIKKNSISIITNVNHWGLSINRILSDKLILGAFFLYHQKNKRHIGKRYGNIDMKRANNLGLKLNWFFDNKSFESGLYLGIRALYSMITPNEGKIKEAYYGEFALGGHWLFSQSYFVNMIIGKGIKLGPKKHRNNYSVFELGLGYRF